MRTIKLIPRAEIDDKRWNGCVHYAINGLPYAYTWYLDNVAEFWDGLVWGDYEAVFPLVHQTIAGVRMLYQPKLAAQLGLFSLRPIDKRLMTQFMEAIPSSYTHWDFNLNSMNPKALEGLEYREHSSWYINLQPVYGEQQDKYSAQVIDALKKTEAMGLRIKQDLKPEIVVEHFKQTTGKQLNLPESAYHSMHRIIYQAQHYGVGGGFGIYREEKLLASTFVLYSRVANLVLLPSFTKDSLDNGAYALIDLFIRNGAGSMRILDAGPFQTPAVVEIFKNYGGETLQYLQVVKGEIPDEPQTGYDKVKKWFGFSRK
ncbi:hypothetical protein BH09BAC1_BH09BAC1_09010 [soil metagenome]